MWDKGNKSLRELKGEMEAGEGSGRTVSVEGLGQSSLLTEQLVNKLVGNVGEGIVAVRE